MNSQSSPTEDPSTPPIPPEAVSTPAEASAPASTERPNGAAKKPRRIVRVAECGLELRQVRIVLLFCTRGEGSQGRPVAEIDCSGELVQDSLTETGFTAAVKWTLKAPESTPPAMTMGGTHELVFSLAKPISDYDARYYATVNSVVLAHPYLRQLVDEFSVKVLGQSVMLRTLDVANFVERKTAEFFKTAAAAETGTDSGDEETPR